MLKKRRSLKLAVIYKNDLEKKDAHRIFNEAKNSLVEENVVITQAKMILNADKKANLTISQSDEGEVTLQVTIRFVNHRDLYASLMKEVLNVSDYTFISQTFNVNDLVEKVVQAAQAGEDMFEFGGYSYSLNNRDMTPKLASVDDLYRVFAGKRTISDENLLMNTTDVKPAVALVRLNVEFHEKEEGEESLDVIINRYQTNEENLCYQNKAVTVYDVLLHYNSYEAKQAEHYRHQFYDRFKLQKENQENMFIGVTL